VKHNHIMQNWDKLIGKVILDCHNICPLEGVYHI
jgi:UDP-N-acetyl-D-mannosaminuronic acid dehydrogenase